ncbi:lantibiotic ABC transporter ATP-binding protein, partial [Bacillus licheniformis]
MSTILLETRHLQKKFGRSQAVSDVSLSVEKNSIYGLLGPNGAGKSTTLKLLTGILNPTAGDILFEGRQWKRSVLKDIGSLIESPPLYDNLTAYE